MAKATEKDNAQLVALLDRALDDVMTIRQRSSYLNNTVWDKAQKAWGLLYDARDEIMFGEINA